MDDGIDLSLRRGSNKLSAFTHIFLTDSHLDPKARNSAVGSAAESIAKRSGYAHPSLMGAAPRVVGEVAGCVRFLSRLWTRSNWTWAD